MELKPRVYRVEVSSLYVAGEREECECAGRWNGQGLEEATSADFLTGKRVAYTATANTVSIIGRIKGKTYYYRVKANKSGWASSGWVTGGNGCKIGI